MNRALYDHFEVTRQAKVYPLHTADKGKFFGLVVEFRGCVNTSLSRVLNFYTHKIEEAVKAGLLSANEWFEVSDARLQGESFRISILNRDARDAIETIKEVLNIDDNDQRTFDLQASRLEPHVDNSWFTPEILNALFLDVVAPTSSAKFENIERVFRLLEEDGFFHGSYSGLVEIKRFANYLPNFNLMMAMANMAEFTKKVKTGKILREQIDPAHIGVFNDVETVVFSGRAIPVRYSHFSGRHNATKSVLPIWVSNITASAPVGGDCFELEIEYVNDPWAAIRLGARYVDRWVEADLTTMMGRGIPTFDAEGFIEGFEGFVFG